MIAPPVPPRAEGTAPTAGRWRRWARALGPLLAVSLPVLAIVVANTVVNGGERAAPYGDRLTAHPAAGPAGGPVNGPVTGPAAAPELRHDRQAVRAYAPGTGTPLWTYARANRRPLEVLAAPGHAFTLWDDGMITDIGHPARTASGPEAGRAPGVRWHRTMPGAEAGGLLAPLDPAGRTLLVLTPTHAVAYGTEAGDLRWILRPRRGCTFRPADRVRIDGVVLIPQSCADPSVPWHRALLAADEHGKVTPGSRPPGSRPDK
ncbi:hypothetical protein DEJ50_25895 [Streptomyces venezuelae]|uniref:Uncharacterized protein n=1 Tax=Streptomyces venezuelae TaxID=54571 RepID=A0A5P2D976_STRVZ|nr:hypothetical protein [Streptomyces venezuelae]QES50757.1 hypothetical protein DEJ50_25895 [Streptomyces venezuelae]